MAVEVSFAVQAHPARADIAADLAARIGGPVDIVLDPDPESLIRSPWRTFRHLLETTPAGATHRLQIQDDAAVCRNLRVAVERAAAARPDRLLVFFVGENGPLQARAVREACQRDEPWAELVHGHWVPVVASCWPVWMIDELTRWADAQQIPPKLTGDDEIVGRFVKAHGHVPLASVPSLVEHLDEVPSLASKRRNGIRLAACWIGDCDSCDDAALIDWNRGPGAPSG